MLLELCFGEEALLRYEEGPVIQAQTAQRLVVRGARVLNQRRIAWKALRAAGERTHDGSESFQLREVRSAEHEHQTRQEVDVASGCGRV